MQGLIPTFSAIVQKLEESNIQYMIVGSIAAMIYGEPRLTHDMDLVIDIAPANAKRFESLFPGSDFYCPPLEVLSSEIVHRGQFNLIHHETGLKIDSPIPREELDIFSDDYRHLKIVK